MPGLRVTFILPSTGRIPCGGFKVVYEYANRLSRKGHSVTVVHTALCRRDVRAGDMPGRVLSYWWNRFSGAHSPRKWFTLDSTVHLQWVPSLHAKYIPNADVVIATAWETAEWVSEYPVSKGQGYYLIQDFEDWTCSRERLLATWKSPLRKIVVAGWLKNIAFELNENAVYIPNGLDFTRFGVDIPPEKRNPHRISMLSHSFPTKGVADGLSALEVVRAQQRDISLVMFGVSEKPSGLPTWVEYCRNPTQATLRQLYNETAIFVAPSWREGWGLTACEAMMCGAAVAAADNGGHREFAVQGKTALLSPPKNPAALACNVLRLMDEPALRFRLAAEAQQYVRQFSWECSVNKFERMLQGYPLDPDREPDRAADSGF